MPLRASSRSRTARSARVGHDAFHAHERDVHARERARQAGVALVRDEADRSRLGDAEVRPGDADVGLEEGVAELPAGRARERLGPRLDGPPLDALEELARRPAAVFSIAGAMMCTGCSPASWRMYSPRSVSTASTPAASSASFSPISSLAIDFDLTASLAPASPADSTTMASRLPPPSAQRCTWPPRASTRPREVVEVAVELRRSCRERIARARSRSSSTSRAARPRLDARSVQARRWPCRAASSVCASASFARAPSRKRRRGCASSLTRQPPCEGGGEVDDRGTAAPLGPRPQVHEAARVGRDERLGARPARGGELVVGHRDARPRAGEPRTSRRSRSRDRARASGTTRAPVRSSRRRGGSVDPELAQHVAGVVVGERPALVHPRDLHAGGVEEAESSCTS